MLILLFVIGTGVAALAGHVQPDVPRAGNFDTWAGLWAGSRTGGSVVCACLYNVRSLYPILCPLLIGAQVIWSYVGFSNANYALAEMHNPARTLRIAGPLALATVTVAYLLCNVAYFAAASKAEIVGSGRLVAALLFRNVWGERAERVLSAFVALSALGNILSVVRIFFIFEDGSLISLGSDFLSRQSEPGTRQGGCATIQRLLEIGLASEGPACGTRSSYVIH